MSAKNCRYNNSHVVRANELLEHEEYCPDRLKRTDIKVCPYDRNHKINIKIYEKHIKNCTSKPKISEDIRKEMEEHIKNRNNLQMKSPWDEPPKSSQNPWEITEIDNKAISIAKTKKIIEETFKDMEYTEDDHIFLEAYIVSQ